MATTVQKSTKINFYKFVQVQKLSDRDVKNDPQGQVSKVIATNTTAINSIGSTLNSIAKILADLKQYELVRLQKLKDSQKPAFIAEYTTPVKKEKSGIEFGGLPAAKIPSFLDALFGFVGGVLKDAITYFALKWIADPKNREKLTNIISAIVKVVKFVASWAKFGVTTTINGLYELLQKNENATFWDRLKGFGKAMIGLGALMLGLRWLKNPLKIVTDFGFVLKTLYNILVKGKAKLVARALKFGLTTPTGLLITGGAVAAAGAYAASRQNEKEREQANIKDDDKTVTPQETKKKGQTPGSQQLIQEQIRQRGFQGFAKGGLVPERAKGGWISGPQSGYPVSLDGGKSTSFIGHGTEYVAQKASGGAFVVPYDTPVTKRQPNLTNKRLGEAKSLGFDIPGFAAGGKVNKQMYLHWTAGTYNHKAGPYHSTVQGDGTIHKNTPYNQKAYHTHGRNSNSIGLSIAAMGGEGVSPDNFGSYAPKQIQYDNMMKEAARIAKLEWKWSPSDVNIRSVMTHAEAASAKDGRTHLNPPSSKNSRYGSRQWDNHGPWAWGGDGTRWDLWNLKPGVGKGKGGDELRAKMRKFMGGSDLVVPEAGPAAGAAAGGGSPDVPLQLSGTAKQLIGNDTAFLNAVNQSAKELGYNPSDLLGVMASESGLNPKARHPRSMATGLIQFTPDTAARYGTSVDALYNMNRAQQMVYFHKFLKASLQGLPRPITMETLYTSVFLPRFANPNKYPSNYPLAKKGGYKDEEGYHHPASWYAQNAGLDSNKDGVITKAEMAQKVAKKKKEFGISGGSVATTGVTTGGAETLGRGDHEDAPPTPKLPYFLGGFSRSANMTTEQMTGSIARINEVEAGIRRNLNANVTSQRSVGSQGSGGGGESALSVGSSSRVATPPAQSATPTITPTATATATPQTVQQSGTSSSSGLVTATESRNQIVQQSQRNNDIVMASTLQLVDQQNRINAQRISESQNAITKMKGGNSQQPQFIPTGNGGAEKKSVVSRLNSFNNPLRGIFK